jgi:hypothetical protein
VSLMREKAKRQRGGQVDRWTGGQAGGGEAGAVLLFHVGRIFLCPLLLLEALVSTRVPFSLRPFHSMVVESVRPPAFTLVSSLVSSPLLSLSLSLQGVRLSHASMQPQPPPPPPPPPHRYPATTTTTHCRPRYSLCSFRHDDGIVQLLSKLLHTEPMTKC